MKIEDVGTNDSHRKTLLNVVTDCFSNIIRLSNTVTGCQGAINSMNGSFVSILVQKVG